MRYHHRWLDVLHFAHRYRKDSYHHGGNPGNKCAEKGLWEEICARTSYNLGADPQSLTNLEDVFGQGMALSEECYVCMGVLKQWRNVVQSRVDSLPRFRSFV